MKVYKQSKWVLFKDIIGAFAGTFVVGLIANIFTSDMRIIILIACAILLILLYLALFSDNIKFEFANGEMAYYKKNKLKDIYALKECGFRYQVKTSNNGTDGISLYVIKDDEETFIDCTPLGQRQFYKMFEQIKEETELDSSPEKLQTIKKGE